MRLLKIALCIGLFSCNSTEKKTSPDKDVKATVQTANIVHYDTLPNGQRLLDNRDSGMNLYYREVVGSDTLKGGYITCYAEDSTMRYFYLRHGDTLHLLNKASNLVTTWSLGTLASDFPSFFIIAIDHGNGAPNTYQVFDKKTANNLLGDNVEAWDSQKVNGVMYFLYDNEKVTDHGSYTDIKKADSLFLYNMQSGSRQGFVLPPLEDSTDNYGYSIQKITATRLVVKRVGDIYYKEKVLIYIR